MISLYERVLVYTNHLDQATFTSDIRTFDATLRNLELIGEGATRTPADVRESHPHILWRRIIGTRNRLAHDYLGVDEDVIWDIVQTQVPSLLAALRQDLGLAYRFSYLSLHKRMGSVRSRRIQAGTCLR